MPSGLRSRRALAGGLIALLLALGGAAYLVAGPAASPAPRHVASRPAAPGAVPSSPVAPAAQPVRTERGLVPVPKRVTIPRLQASAPVVEQVGVLASGPEKGLLSAPNDYHDLGWYEHDGTGVLVIDGHVGFASGSGPLAYIGQLKKGDRVVIRYASGTKSYEVTGIHVAKKGSLSPSYFSKAYDGDVMLITCDYLSSFRAGHFADNVFVIAKPRGR